MTVLDLVYLRQDRTLQVGTNPINLVANPVRNEIYVVNTQSGTISVIDAETNRIAATIAVHRLPSFVSVDPTGHRAYVANSGSNTISVLDLDRRREITVAGTGEQPDVDRISPDGRSLVVTNRGAIASPFSMCPHTIQPPRPNRPRTCVRRFLVVQEHRTPSSSLTPLRLLLPAPLAIR